MPIAKDFIRGLNAQALSLHEDHATALNLEISPRQKKVVKRVAVLCDLLGIKGHNKLVAIAGALFQLSPIQLHRKVVSQLEADQAADPYGVWLAYCGYLEALETELRSLSVRHEIITIACQAGFFGLLDHHLQDIVNHGHTNNFPLARMVVYYVDSYTINGDPVAPYDSTTDMNELDRTMQVHLGNPDLKQVSEYAKSHFYGQSGFLAQWHLAKRIEEYLAEILIVSPGREFLPRLLPQFVDMQEIHYHED